jgi:hypothetical protein
VLRRWFGGRAAGQWSSREGAEIRRGYLAVAVLALLACVVAASRALEASAEKKRVPGRRDCP